MTEVTDIFIFNPEQDLALAHGGINYVPPPHAVTIRRDLALLPAWLSNGENAKILVIDNQDTTELQRFADNNNLNIEVITPQHLKHFTNAAFYPWGWNADLRRRLIKWGANEDALPSLPALEKWRQLAHRRSSIAILQRMNELIGSLRCPLPVEFFDTDEALKWAKEHSGCYLKAPWSGSGSGIWHVTAPASTDVAQWCRGVIKRQGSIIAEIGQKREMDFAAEFFIDGRSAQSVKFIGFSVFSTDAHNQYTSSIINSTEYLHNLIASKANNIDNIISALTLSLKELLLPSGYYGYAGIDMFAFIDHNNQSSINPCVELNLRMTMGTVTASLGDKHNFIGRYTISNKADLKFTSIAITPIYSTTKHVAVVNKCQ